MDKHLKEYVEFEKSLKEYRTLEEDLTECFKKRNIEVLELSVNVRKGEYKIKVKYPNSKTKKSSNSRKIQSATDIHKDTKKRLKVYKKTHFPIHKKYAD